MSSDLPLQIVTFWWFNESAKHRWNYEFTADHVDRLYRGWKRNLTIPFDFHVFVDGQVPHTDIREEGVNVHMLPQPWFDVLARFGRAYCKLGIFSWDMREQFGPCKLLTTDLDMCIVGNCDDIVHKGYESSFHGYMDTKNPRMYSGSFHMQTAGEHRQVWDSFSMVRKIDQSTQEMVGSDQCWMTAILGENTYPRWTEADGIYDYWKIEDMERLPDNARIVMVNGMHRDVSLPAFQDKHEWLKESWV